MATFSWNGRALLEKATEAAKAGIDRTMSECVDDARRGHEAYPPASQPGEKYANRTGFDVQSIRILDNADGSVGATLEEGKVHGRWGSLSNIALFLEIGTSVAGPNAMEREDAAGGDMDAIAPPIGPLMAARPTLRPASDREYPLLRPRIGAAFRGEEMP